MRNENTVRVVIMLCTLLLAPVVAVAADARPAGAPPGSLSEPIVPPQRADPAPAHEAGSSGDEERPPVGKGEFFAEPQIRYCLAEGARIEAVRKLLNRYNHAEIRRFNAQVADFNARCSSYRFYGDALQNARTWLDAARPRIEQEARAAHVKAAAADAQIAKQAAAARAEVPARAPPPDKQEPASRRSAQTREQVRPQPPSPQPRPAPQQAARAAEAQAPRQATADVETAMPGRSADEPVSARAPAVQETPAATAAPDRPRAPPRAAAPQTPSQPAPAGEGSQARPPDAPRAPPRPAAPQPQSPPAVASEESSTPPPEVAVAEAAPTASAAPAAAGSPQTALERLTQEVRSMGSMVLDRPPDGKSGDVTAQLEVRYAEGGYINSIVVAQSSGSPALDEQALAVARVLRLPNAPPELRAQAFAVRFPVVFRSAR